MKCVPFRPCGGREFRGTVRVVRAVRNRVNAANFISIGVKLDTMPASVVSLGDKEETVRHAGQFCIGSFVWAGAASRRQRDSA